MNVKCALNMTRPLRFLSALALLVAAASAAAGNFDRGLLWKIERGDAAPSYLFGTMHSEDPDVLRLPAEVQHAFDRSDGLTLEVVLDAASLLSMTTAFMLTDGSSLESHIGSRLYKRAVAAMAEQGMPEMVIAGMKPWAVAVTLMTPPTRTGQVLDLVLYQRAIAAGKPVEGLETALEQMAVFDQLSKSDQVSLLEDTLDNLDSIEQMLGELKEAYLARDLKRLVEISDASMRTSDPGLVERFNARLIVERNHRMADRLQSGLQSGRQFVAVGALHLPGDEGLLNLLDKRGYRITRLY
jgi:uncharacterized protein YbaP (TraB family)